MPASDLPDWRILVPLVVAALDEVAGGAGPFPNQNALFEALKRRLKELLSERVDCNFGRSRARGYEREWLFDFCATINEKAAGPGTSDDEYYLKQTLVVGEVEAGGGLGTDFNKLLIVDSLVCFFAFPDWLGEHLPRNDLDFFEELARKRVHRAAGRGLNTAFVVSSYRGRSGKFEHRKVSPPLRS